MEDLIKRSDAIKAVCFNCGIIGHVCRGSTETPCDDAKAIMELPSADRPQGEWIGCRHEDSEWLSPMADFYKCSICGKIVNLLQMRSYNFCPNCGSRMSKGADNE